ncbi:MAG: Matrixin [Gemmataceae bacterium]|nr:Matrixin [Gemmataceae bacterium]
MNQPSPRRLSVELLEDRTTPTASPWLNAGKLTLSFVPDGTDTGGGTPSNLMATLGTSAQASWEQEILRAFQTWAVQANINVAVVSDQGQPLGTPGLTQGDPRFGDIRIAARPLGDPETGGLAQTITADGTGGTWAGDMILNSQASIGIGGTGGQADLFTVALHEAGHSFGFPDETTDPTSVMYTTYQPRTGLSPADIAAVRSVYGPPSGDPFGSGLWNSTTDSAFDLTGTGNLTAVSADVAKVGGAEVFQFTTPSARTGITGLTVNVQAAGVSLFTPQVTILDGNGNAVVGAVAPGPLTNTLSITLPNYSPSTTYYVQVQGAGTDVFSAGAYNLRLNYSPVSYGNTFNLGATYVNSGRGQNHTAATAQTLGFSSFTQATSFSSVGAIATAGVTDWYRITPMSLSFSTGTLTVGVVGLDAKGLLPTVAVYNSAGRQLPSAVVANENGTFTVQLAGQQAWTTYYLQVSAANPAGVNATGRYALWADLSQIAPTTFTALTTATLTAAANTTYSQITTTDTRLIQFSLSATTTAGTTAAVRATIFDAQGRSVFTTVAVAGAPLVTGSLWLPGGTYTVVFNAATAAGSLFPGLTYQLSFRDRSEPIDPYPIDPLNPSPPASPPPPAPPSGPVVVVSPPAPLPPIGVVIGPLISPLLGL